MHIVSKSMLLMLVSSSVLTNTFAGIEKWKIKGEKIKCESGECYQVKKGCFKSWEPLTHTFTNFEVEEGKQYKLLVNNTPNAVNVNKVIKESTLHNKISNHKVQSENFWGKNLIIKKVNGKTITRNNAFLNFDIKENRVAGNGGCNGLGGSIKITGNAITISDIMMTMMACLDDNISTIENNIVNAIRNKTLYYTSIDNKVILKDKAGDNVLEMQFYTDSELKEILSSSFWKLNFLYSEGKEYKDMGLRFDFQNSVANGNTGCNGISIPFMFNNGTIQFKEAIATMRACLDAEIQDNEQKFIRLLNNKSYVIEVIGDRLIFQENGRSVAIFSK